MVNALSAKPARYLEPPVAGRARSRADLAHTDRLIQSLNMHEYSRTDSLGARANAATLRQHDCMSMSPSSCTPVQTTHSLALALTLIHYRNPIGARGSKFE